MPTLRDLVPILDWLPDYGPEDARGDLAAGATVGVMLIPQGMAYAVLAGMPPIYGLYASLVPLLVYPLFGTSRHLAVGVNAAIMVIVAAGLTPLARPGSELYVGLALVLTAMVGALMLLMGVARMGFLASLLARPVIVGFTTAAALIIAFSQVGNLLGLDLPSTQFVHEVTFEAYRQIGEASVASVALGGGGVLVLVALQRWKPLFPSELMVLAVGTVAAWHFDLAGHGIKLVGEVPSGLPSPELPPVSTGYLSELWPTALALAMVQFMSVVSLGRAFSARHRYTIDPDRELVAVGGANLLGGFFQAIPTTGSFSRTAVNEQAGARSQLANVVAAALVGLTLLFFTPVFRYLPMPLLASIILVAAVALIDPAEIEELFRAKPSDGWIATLTFAAILGLGIQEGILLGIGAAVLAVLYRQSRPNVAELGHLPSTRSFRNLERFEASTPVEGILMLRLEAGFSFFNATFFKDFVLEKTKAGEGGGEGEHRAVIIEGKSINYLDTTALQAMEEIVGTLHEWGIEIHFTGLKGPVRDVLERSRVGKELLGEDRFHMNPHFAVESILESWDEEDGTRRLEAYQEATEQQREDVQPTSESPFT